jgi:hypothetical protein
MDGELFQLLRDLYAEGEEDIYMAEDERLADIRNEAIRACISFKDELIWDAEFRRILESHDILREDMPFSPADRSP